MNIVFENFTCLATLFTKGYIKIIGNCSNDSDDSTIITTQYQCQRCWITKRSITITWSTWLINFYYYLTILRFLDGFRGMGATRRCNSVKPSFAINCIWIAEFIRICVSTSFSYKWFLDQTSFLVVMDICLIYFYVY